MRCSLSGLFLLTWLAGSASPAVPSSRSGLSSTTQDIGVPGRAKPEPRRYAEASPFSKIARLRTGRTIDIHFIVVEAKHRTGRAMAYNPGGPGASATAAAGDYADATGTFATLRERYDFLFVDNRGTGESAPQGCDFAPAAHPELYFRQLWPDTIVRSCHDRLAAQANLSLYSTSEASDDLDDVRAALGYPKLVLYGGSYGTRFYLDYARRHPASVESIVLEGVAPPHFYILPLPMARGAQTAIEHLEQACSHDTTCSAHFPHFAEHFNAVVQRFDAGAVTLSVQNAVTQRRQSVQLTKEVFAETIRHELYFPTGAAYVPVTIERAYYGDYTALGEMVGQMAIFFSNSQATGLNLSVTCAEDIPFITEADVARYGAGTFEGDARVRAQQRACKIWNVDPVAAAFVEPVRSDAPILMISGGDDPATPPEYAREALAYLPNARIMLVPGASHDSDYPPCVYADTVAFIRAGSAAGSQSVTSCAATYKRPSFVALAYDESAAGEDRAQNRTIHEDSLRAAARPARSIAVDGRRIETVSGRAAQGTRIGLPKPGRTAGHRLQRAVRLAEGASLQVSAALCASQCRGDVYAQLIKPHCCPRPFRLA